MYCRALSSKGKFDFIAANLELKCAWGAEACLNLFEIGRKSIRKARHTDPFVKTIDFRCEF